MRDFLSYCFPAFTRNFTYSPWSVITGRMVANTQNYNIRILSNLYCCAIFIVFCKFYFNIIL